MFNRSDLGKKLIALRKTKGLTQKQLADTLTEKYHLSLTQDTISRLEQGNKEFSCDVLVILSDFFSVSFDYLLGTSVIKTNDIELKSVCDYTKLNEVTIKRLKELPVYPTIINLLLNNDNFEIFKSFCFALAYIGYFEHLSKKSLKELLNTCEITEEQKLTVDNYKLRSEIMEYRANKELNKLFEKVVTHFKAKGGKSIGNN